MQQRNYPYKVCARQLVLAIFSLLATTICTFQFYLIGDCRQRWRLKGQILMSIPSGTRTLLDFCLFVPGLPIQQFVLVGVLWTGCNNRAFTRFSIRLTLIWRWHDFHNSLIQTFVLFYLAVSNRAIMTFQLLFFDCLCITESSFEGDTKWLTSVSVSLNSVNFYRSVWTEITYKNGAHKLLPVKWSHLIKSLDLKV